MLPTLKACVSMLKSVLAWLKVSVARLMPPPTATFWLTTPTLLMPRLVTLPTFTPCETEVLMPTFGADRVGEGGSGEHGGDGHKRELLHGEDPSSDFV